MRNLFLFAVLTWMTGNPILALVVVVLVSAVTYGYITARLFRVPRAIAMPDDRSRTREPTQFGQPLRDEPVTFLYATLYHYQ